MYIYMCIYIYIRIHNYTYICMDRVCHLLCHLHRHTPHCLNIQQIGTAPRRLRDLKDLDRSSFLPMHTWTYARSCVYRRKALNIFWVISQKTREK